MTTTSSPLLSQTQASEVHEANRVAIAAVAFALITYISSLLILCRRRCCNSKLGCANWCGCPSRILYLRCDGRLVSRQWGRYACLLSAFAAICGACMTMVFFIHYPWTVQHQLQSSVAGCNYTVEALIQPCGMSYQVFWTSVSSYVVYLCVVVMSWDACIVLLPFAMCWTRTWTRYREDDERDLGWKACMGEYDDYEGEKGSA